MRMMYESIARILVEKFDVPPEQVRPESVLGDLDLDSLARLEFTETLRESCGAELTDDDVVHSATLASLAALAAQKSA
ncbi:acyl carrier protein [Streptomyces sp. MW-W600-10]|uniref:acyl carrier protein n=1 Tax=Streptomyces sp. MW-W600-10 TaxID=2829819 RepID=UPI00210E693A|nr:phosphopantetheine-binding protein [Streptomyces sp. MW-W600-10]